jgi:Rubrerythrin
MENTLKVKVKTYKAVKEIADESGLSLGEVADTLINEGLSGAKDLGRMSEGKIDLNNLRADLDGVKAHNRRLQRKVDELTEEVEGEDAVEPAGVLTKEDLLGRKPKFRKENNVVARCDSCGEALDDEEKPERCPGCGVKLDWDKKGEGTGAGTGAGWVIAGVIALALLNRRAQAGL